MSGCRLHQWISWAVFVMLTTLTLSVNVAEAGGVTDPEVKMLLEHLSVKSHDDAARFKLARHLTSTGKYPQALRYYDRLVRENPENVDYSFGRAQILTWLHRDSEALTELKRAKRLAPDYEAVWRLDFSVAKRQRNAIIDVEALREDAAKKFPSADWWKSATAPLSYKWRLTLGGSHEDLTNDRPNWGNQFVELDWKPGSESQVFARAERDSRFNASDGHYSIGGDWQLTNKWRGAVELVVSPSPNFHPKKGFLLHAHREIGDGWGADFRWRQRSYDSATVSSYSVAAERYFGNYRAAYSVNLSHLHNSENSLAHTLVLNWYMTDKSSLGIVLAVGEEAEAVAPGLVIQTEVESVTLSGRHKLNDRLALNWWAGAHRQGDLYRRRYVGLAVSVGI